MEKILDKIRSCTVFIFVVSEDALQSKACMAELRYAAALGKPIVPVQVGKVEIDLADPLSRLQIVAYRPEDAVTGFGVVAAVVAAEQRARPLPSTYLRNRRSLTSTCARWQRRSTQRSYVRPTKSSLSSSCGERYATRMHRGSGNRSSKCCEACSTSLGSPSLPTVRSVRSYSSRIRITTAILQTQLQESGPSRSLPDNRRHLTTRGRSRRSGLRLRASQTRLRPPGDHCRSGLRPPPSPLRHIPVARPHRHTRLHPTQLQSKANRLGRPLPNRASAGQADGCSLVIMGVIGGAGWYATHTAPASAAVGDCLAQTGGNELTKVGCGDPSARFKVLGKLENKTMVDASLDACAQFPKATSSYWEGKSRELGLVLCLAPVERAAAK